MVMIHDFLNMFLSEFFSFFKGININKTAQTFKVLKVLKVLKNFLCSFNREATMLFLVFNKLIYCMMKQILVWKNLSIFSVLLRENTYVDLNCSFVKIDLNRLK